MRKYLINTIVILLIFVAAKSVSLNIKTCKTCKNTSIKDAILNARPHDTIFIKDGVYHEFDLIIDKPLHITGEKNTVIDGGGKGYIFKVHSDSVAISGLHLRNTGQSYTKDYAAIYISKCKHFEISDMRLENVFFGLLVEKSHFGIIKDNHISSHAVNEAGSGNGIHLWHSSDIIIEDNETHNLRDGIYFEFVSNTKVINNRSHDNLRYGLHFMFSNNDEYRNNIFTNNGAGVAVMFSKFINMSNNKFFKNWGCASYGLLLKEIYDAEIENNTFEQNTIGINLEGSTRINYRNNNFISNGWAVKIAGACYSNKFIHNNFLNNSFDISYNSQLNDNEFNNNFWSAYTGYDLDKNGIGDVPYRPVKLFSYIVNQTPETIVLLRSLFVDIINFSEKISPVFTPDNIVDLQPLMKAMK
jgi:nitrous oxidase accessory protein